MSPLEEDVLERGHQLKHKRGPNRDYGMQTGPRTYISSATFCGFTEVKGPWSAGPNAGFILEQQQTITPNFVKIHQVMCSLKCLQAKN